MQSPRRGRSRRARRPPRPRSRRHGGRPRGQVPVRALRFAVDVDHRTSADGAGSANGRAAVVRGPSVERVPGGRRRRHSGPFKTRLAGEKSLVDATVRQCIGSRPEIYPVSCDASGSFVTWLGRLRFRTDFPFVAARCKHVTGFSVVYIAATASTRSPNKLMFYTRFEQLHPQCRSRSLDSDECVRIERRQTVGL